MPRRRVCGRGLYRWAVIGPAGYAWDRLDNGGVPSAEQIHPEWQHLSVWDHLASTPSGSAWFEGAALDPEALSGCEGPSTCAQDSLSTPSGPRPPFFLSNAPQSLLYVGAGQTRPGLPLSGQVALVGSEVQLALCG